MAKTSETLDKAQQLAMEARIRAGMMVSDYRRSNIVRLRRARRYASNLHAWLPTWHQPLSDGRSSRRRIADARNKAE